MIHDEHSDVVFHYRAVAREMPDPAMDAVILDAASRAIAARKTRQRWIAAATALAASVAALVVGFGMHDLQPDVRDPKAASYGRFEGNTRLFLMRQSDAVDVGPGGTSFIRLDTSAEDGAK